MIPKVIHYCWFGRNPLPELAIKCIESWKKFLPNYEIKEWNEDNFDVNMIPYTSEAYQAKKYAFVSDYARFWILHKYGGIYFDTDVEVIKSMDDIIDKGAFMGCEYDSISDTGKRIAPGLVLCAGKNNKMYTELLSYYSSLHFRCMNGKYDYTDITIITTNIFRKFGLKENDDIQLVEDNYIYPKEYFSPLKDGTLYITDNTYSIHHYAGSWLPKKTKLKIKISKLVGGRITNAIINIKKNFCK